MNEAKLRTAERAGAVLCIAWLLLACVIVLDWRVTTTVALGGALVWLGYRLAVEKLAADRRRVQRAWAALDSEWKALDRTQRIRDTVFNARIAMREAARRYAATDEMQDGGR